MNSPFSLRFEHKKTGNHKEVLLQNTESNIEHKLIKKYCPVPGDKK